MSSKCVSKKGAYAKFLGEKKSYILKAYWLPFYDEVVDVASLEQRIRDRERRLEKREAEERKRKEEALKAKREAEWKKAGQSRTFILLTKQKNIEAGKWSYLG